MQDWYEKTVLRLINENKDSDELRLVCLAISLLDNVKQILVYGRFINKATDTNIIKRMMLSRHEYRKLKREAISDLSKIFGYQDLRG